ncbi:MAG TPA: sigma factor-like helix-turn-helix DNA-binding protein [Acidimicrobiales bacterium]|jgi:DNA-directed RNA polymerase sigma subunit (sigma70/sigma32)|nr:sigma factor-like helix-turn-helix DNA-binding protein [Acidimicrobiales bacterium]
MTYLWPNEDGWPYPDGVNRETVDLDQSVDDDALVLRAAPPHLFDDLDPLERRVVRAHYGLDGSPPRSMKELRADLGLPRTEVREALASGLAKLRARLVE